MSLTAQRRLHDPEEEIAADTETILYRRAYEPVTPSDRPHTTRTPVVPYSSVQGSLKVTGAAAVLKLYFGRSEPGSDQADFANWLLIEQANMADGTNYVVDYVVPTLDVLVTITPADVAVLVGELNIGSEA